MTDAKEGGTGALDPEPVAGDTSSDTQEKQGSAAPEAEKAAGGGDSESPAATTSDDVVVPEPAKDADAPAECAEPPGEAAKTIPVAEGPVPTPEKAPAEPAQAIPVATDSPADAADAEKPAEPAAEEPAPEPVVLPPPHILGLEPAHGPFTGGTSILVTGEAFVEGCVVLFDGRESKTTFESATAVRTEAPVPDATGHVDVRVVNPDGQNEVRINGYHYDLPPEILRVEPACVPVQGGATVTLFGTDFVDGCAVRTGDKLLPSVWVDSTRVEAIATAHAAGPVDLELTNPDGQTSKLPRGLHFDEPPVIAKVSPSEGSVAGGTEVTITGRAFFQGCKVVLAGMPVAETTFVSDTELRFTTPRHGAPLPVDLSVVNPSSLEARSALAFVYKPAAPRIDSVSPAAGPSAGGTVLTVRGRDFDEGAAIYICGIAAQVTRKSADELEVVTPPVSRDGLVELRVVNRDDQAHTAERVFRYEAPMAPPVLTSVSPNKGSQTGGLKVAILGDEFTDRTMVRFGAIPAAVKFLTKKELEAEAPPAQNPGEVAVEVVNPDGVTAVLEAAFTYEAKPAPTIAGVTPKNGPTTGGTKLVIEGTNFTKDSFVYIGREHPKDIAVKSATEIHVVTAPRKAAGIVDVEVGAPDVPKAVMKNAFSFDAVPAPVITSVSPNQGGIGGGTEVTVMGKNFLKETTVLVDGKPAKHIKLVDKQTIEFKTPPGDANKMADVVVRNPDGKEAVQKRAFLYDPRYRG